MFRFERRSSAVGDDDLFINRRSKRSEASQNSQKAPAKRTFWEGGAIAESEGANQGSRKTPTECVLWEEEELRSDEQNPLADFEISAESSDEVKLGRAYGECLGIRSRRRT